MSEIKYYTRDGLKALQDQLDVLTSIERPRISQMIAEARDKGDLSENAEYDAAKEQQGLLELKISKLQALIMSARVIDEGSIDISKVSLFTRVKIRNLKNGAEMCYTIVPESEASLKEGKISVTSPIARGLLGRKAGEETEIEVPAGKVKFQIVEITK